MKRLSYVLIFCITALMLVSCGKKEDSFLPMSDLQLGMTLEEVIQSEPDILQQAETDQYLIEKAYCGLNVGIMVMLEEGKVSAIIGDADPSPNVDKAAQAFGDFCNKRYTLEEAEDIEELNMEMKTWNTGEYDITLCVGKESKGSEDRKFIFVLSVY